MNKKIVLSADLGGTNLRMAAVGENGELFSRIKVRTPRSKSHEKIVEKLVETANECLLRCRVYEVKGVSIAVPATVNANSGEVIRAPNLSELDGISIAPILQERLGIPCVLENDANAATIGENWLGASKGFSNSIMITLGTGIGGGIILDGKVLRGVDGTASEIGHICVEPRGVECGCGSRGCVEQYASASALVRLAREASVKVRNSEMAKISNLSSKNIYQLGKRGDKSALEIFNQQGFYLGIAIAGLINTLNPEVVIIGGGAAAGWKLFIPQTKEQIRIRAYRKPAERAQLVRAKLGDNAGILGAAYLGFDIFPNHS